MYVGFGVLYFSIYLTFVVPAASRAAHVRGSLLHNDPGLGEPPPDFSVGDEEFATVLVDVSVTCHVDVDVSVTVCRPLGHVDASRVLSFPEVHFSSLPREFRP